jgi:hypothetical protein
MTRRGAVVVAAAWLALSVGCAKTQTSSTAPAPVVAPPAPPTVEPAPVPPPAPPAESGPALAIVRTYEETLAGGKRSVKLVLRGEEDDAAVTRLLTDFVDANRREGEELWVAVFFEGMDLQSIEYAFAVAKPGRRPYITVRESLQTYR